jgi:hypothetical protein
MGQAGPVSFQARAMFPGLGQENWRFSNTKIHFCRRKTIKVAEKSRTASILIHVMLFKFISPIDGPLGPSPGLVKWAGLG